MTENHRPSHLSTADVAQDQAEESTFGPDQEMEQIEHFQEGRPMPLLPGEDTDRFQSRWVAIQAKLRQDLDAVWLAGLTLPWSQGQTEGQVTKLKLLRSQMYGRETSTWCGSGC
jgi:hypothetical protein